MQHAGQKGHPSECQAGPSWARLDLRHLMGEISNHGLGRQNRPPIDFSRNQYESVPQVPPRIFAYRCSHNLGNSAGEFPMDQPGSTGPRAAPRPKESASAHGAFLTAISTTWRSPHGWHWKSLESPWKNMLVTDVSPWMIEYDSVRTLQDRIWPY